MSYGVIIPVNIAAQNVDAWTRSAISATDVENGGIFQLASLYDSTNASGDAEVWLATAPASSGSHLTDLWMAYEPELVWTGSYRGLDPDVRNFYVAAGKVFTAFKPQLHDLLLMDGDAFYNSKAANTAAIATDGDWQLVWNTGDNAKLCVTYLATQYISIGTGAIDDQRVTAYLMEVTGV